MLKKHFRQKYSFVVKNSRTKVSLTNVTTTDVTLFQIRSVTSIEEGKMLPRQMSPGQLLSQQMLHCSKMT